MTMLIPIRDHNPYKRFPIITVVLIAINVWVFLVVPPTTSAAFHYGAVPCDVLGRCPSLSNRLHSVFPDRSPWLALVTAMFVHGSLAHLGANMLYLWVFGNNVEDVLGRLRYTVFYFVTGLAATMTHFGVSSSSSVPIVGASGAISGVLGAYYVLFPTARILSLVPFLLFIPVEVSAHFLLGMWFLMQLLYGVVGVGSSRGPGVAFFAHVGGFAAGWAMVRGFARRRQPEPDQLWFGRGAPRY
jgi:membrane associated rhomboid family serine protease